jgi:glycosyltransferase involved in cell wall biosynthesis
MPGVPSVLVVIDSLAVGGPSRTVVASATGLRRRGVDVRLAHLGIGDAGVMEAELQAGHVPVLNLALGSLANPSTALLLAAYIRRERLDVVHSHNRYGHLVGRLAAAAAGRPIVSTVHHLIEPAGTWRDLARRRLDDFTARWCTLILTVSEAQRRAYLRRVRLRPDHVETHRNGIDTSVFRPDSAVRARMRAELGVQDGAPLFVSVGALIQAK